MSRKFWAHQLSFNLRRRIGWRAAASLTFALLLVAGMREPRAAGSQSAPASTQDQNSLEARRKYEEAEALRNQGTAESLRQALKKYEEALLLDRAPSDQALMFNKIGSVHESLGEWQKALDAHNRALPIQRAIGDRQGEAYTLNSIGFVYEVMGKHQKALDFEASRATATSDQLGQYRYIHFATHGLADSERPELSTIALSLFDEQGRPQDGFLRAHEVYNLELPAELVTLSACEMGLGKLTRGEGLVSLTRGFMYAGAARVVVSLWSLSDRATAELMEKFYRRMLVGGERPAAALRAAQVEMWRDKRWEAPYYWAAFTLQGEWR
jgi:tetratricopeptide (TPR) repeat protein